MTSRTTSRVCCLEPVEASSTGTSAVSTEALRARHASANVKDAAEEFLAQRQIAVAGVSRSPKDHGANVVYKLADRDYEVFAITRTL